MNRIGKSVIIFLLILILILCIIIKKKFTEKFISDNKIPKIIHQTWKTNSLPEKFQRWSKTIKELHPDWEYKLWTDEDNRNFIKKEYPWFLKTYDGYNKNIKRVDAVRYFYLYHYGGVYIDLDFVCLKSMDNLLNNKEIVLGQLEDINHPQSIPNAIMISKPRDKFWMYVINKLPARMNKGNPESDTGPIFLTQCVKEYNKNNNKSNITLLNSNYFYPIDWTTQKGQKYRKNIPSDLKKEFPDSYFVTFWTSSWKNNNKLKNLN